MMPNTPHSSLNLSSMLGHSPCKNAFDCRRPDSFSVVNRDVDDYPSCYSDPQPVTARFSNHSCEDAGHGAALQNFGDIVGRNGDDHTRCRFAEQRHRIVQPAVATDVQRLNRDFGAGTAGIEATLRECHDKTTIRTIVRRTDQSFGGKVDHQPLQRPFCVEIQFRWHPTHYIVNRREIFAAAKLTTAFAEEHDHVAGALKAARDDTIGTLEHADDADDRRRENRLAFSFIVQTDVAASDGYIERATSLGDSLDGFGELPHDLR